MTKKSSPFPARAELERLRASVVEARAKVDEVREEESTFPGRVKAAREAITAHHEGVASGARDPDADREASLIAELRELERDVTYISQQFGTATELVPTSLVIEGRLAGARRVLGAAESAVGLFVNQHGAELSAELRQRAEVARDALVDAWRGMQAAAEGWRAVRAEWMAIIDRLGIEPRDVPPFPVPALSDLGREFARVGLGPDGLGNSTGEPELLLPAPCSSGNYS